MEQRSDNENGMSTPRAAAGGGGSGAERSALWWPLARWGDWGETRKPPRRRIATPSPGRAGAVRCALPCGPFPSPLPPGQPLFRFPRLFLRRLQLPPPPPPTPLGGRGALSVDALPEHIHVPIAFIKGQLKSVDEDKKNPLILIKYIVEDYSP